MSGLILGIESSCDETAAAVVADGRRVLSNVIASQIDLHARYGGVVPEIASRQHLESMLPTIQEALSEAGVGLSDLDAIAVTRGPGLIGTLLVGLSAAKALAFATGLPLVGVNHLAGHIYANFLVEPPPVFPFVCLIVSGGHTDLVYLRSHSEHELLGRTRDDAAGEAFDKVARVLGLGYPGGPQVERLAAAGDPTAVAFPRAYLDDSLDFSFSGLKTAVLQRVHKHPPDSDPARAALAASFQAAVVEVLADKLIRAARSKGAPQVLLAGGVAANGALRSAVAARAARAGLRFGFPPPLLCTDNAAMIAAAGYYALQAGQVDALDLNADASLPLF